MAEGKKKKSGTFPLLKFINFVAAAYFVILGIGVNIPYLDLIPVKISFFVAAALLVFANFSAPSEHGMRKRIAHDIEHK